jgi:glutathione S-transferase
MLRIWGRDTSTNVMKVIWLLEEMQLPYQRIDAGGTFGMTDTAAYRGKNPTGLVPTLEEEDGFTLFESNAILRYLAASHRAGDALWPADLRLRADIDRWMDFQQTVMNPRMVAVFQPLIRLKPEQRDPEKIAQAAQVWAAGWDMLLPWLEGQPYIAGAQFSLADIPLGPLLHRYYALPIERPDRPALRAWYDRLLERPAYAAHVARPLV